MRALSLSLAASLVLLGGCDRYAADSAPLPLAPPAAADTPTMYVKGAVRLAPGASYQFRAELVDDVVSYDWFVSSPEEIAPGEVEIVPYADTRFATVTGRVPGPVTVRAIARDANGRVLATGGRSFPVTE